MIDAGAAWYSLGSPAVRGGVVGGGMVGGGGAIRGRVCAVFRRAVYLRFGGTLVAVGSGAIPSGPLHLRTPRFAEARLAVGDPVTLESGVLHAGRLEVEVRGDHCWVPPAVDASALRAAAGGWLAADPPADDAGGIGGAAAPSVAGGDLDAVADALVGRGSGLTPEGDDILAGIVVVDALLHPENDTYRCGVAARAAVRTNDVAAAFLAWAAVGQSIGPTHNLLVAVAAGNHRTAFAARAELTGIGASSGAALLHGVQQALAGVADGIAAPEAIARRCNSDATSGAMVVGCPTEGPHA